MLTIVKKNDSYDAITYQLENEDNSTVDLTGASVNFVMGKKNKLITNAKATVTSATSGIVSYQLTPLDTLVSGTFLAEFVVTFANGTTKTYPSNGYITVDVEQNLDTSQANVIVDMIAEKQGDFTSKLNSILLQAGNINMSAMNEYSWTATEGQLIFIFPSSVNYTPSTKWFQVSVGNVPVDNTLVNRSYDNQFALNIDSSNIKAGMTVRAMWVEPITPVVPTSYKIIPQQNLPPVDAGEGDLWFDTSDNSYQGTIFDNLNSQLVDITSKKADWVTPEQYGAIGNGVADDTVALQSAINYCIANKKVLRGKDNAIYGIKATLTVNGFIDMMMNTATIKALVAIDKMIFYQFPSDYRDSSKDLLGNMSYCSLHLEGNSLANYGIYVDNCACITFINTKIRYCTTGVFISNCSEILWENLYIRGDASVNSVGINNTAFDCLFNFVYMMNCYTGYISTGSLNHITNLHIWMSKNFNGSTGIKHMGGGLFIVNAYIDSFAHSFYSNASSQLMLTNVNTFINGNLYNATFDTPVIFYSDGTQKFSNTFMTNSYISGSSTTILSNQSNLQLNDTNVSYDLAGAWVEVGNMNKKDITLPTGIVTNPDTTIGRAEYYFKGGDYGTEIHLNIQCPTGFTYGQSIGTVKGFRKNTYVSCLISDSQFFSTNVYNATLIFQTTGNIVLKHNITGITPTYLTCNTIIPGRA
jgi:hypothetical protein